ncbi:Amidase 1 [Geodia barretti]|uniref:Amidase 1 n=1 Tax=Geodia barretti TaxID=519541 RepID=A0AA35QZM2_GEOBA|nr:Amidase 1 [Geodia barretti]
MGQHGVLTDDLNAFANLDVHVPGAPDGPLSGMTFAAKDIFDVAGHVTGGGNPDWQRTHGPAESTAPAVQMLLDAGATLVGKTHTDELTRGILGRNPHYGTPVNPAAPGRVPGGSSSGSASAVAGGVVDFALGSDTGGSVRMPSSFCGLYDQVAASNAVRQEVRSRVNDLLGDGAIICMPSSPAPAPLPDMPVPERQELGVRIGRLTCIGGMTGCPQINLPLAKVDGLPVGLSLMGARGSDEMLMRSQ